mmetsp:Transcript_26638/g.30606  ORF Transcript_26638/g.30606 Transcript_26638/m.30606 type:complete len:84 (+) Transcript_26638:1374-1625(+)
MGSQEPRIETTQTVPKRGEGNNEEKYHAEIHGPSRVAVTISIITEVIETMGYPMNDTEQEHRDGCNFMNEQVKDKKLAYNACP